MLKIYEFIITGRHTGSLKVYTKTLIGSPITVWTKSGDQGNVRLS